MDASEKEKEESQEGEGQRREGCDDVHDEDDGDTKQIDAPQYVTWVMETWGWDGRRHQSFGIGF